MMNGNGDDEAQHEEDPEIVAPHHPPPPPASLNLSSSPSPSPPQSTSPLSSPTAAPRPHRGASNGYVSEASKKAMDLSSYGSPTSASASSSSSSSSSSGFLSSLTKKTTKTKKSASSAALSTAAAGAAAGGGAAPTSPKGQPASAAAAKTASPRDAFRDSPPPKATAGSPPAPSASSAPSLPSSSSFPSSSALSSAGGGGGGGSKFPFGGSLQSMFKSLTTGPSSSSSSSSSSGSSLSSSEALKEQHKKDWLALLPSDSAPATAATSFTNPKVKARCVKLAWYGIPSSVRGDAWSFIIGNALNITEDLFWIMSGRAQEVKETKKLRLEREQREAEAGGGGGGGGGGGSTSSSSTSSHSPNKEESVALIDTDIARTFPELKFFHDGGPLQAPLFQVLESYGCYRPDMGYVQGMSYLCAVFLLNMEPLQAFVALCNLLNQEMYFKFFRMNAAQMAVYLEAFQQCFKEQLPALHAHFAAIGVLPDMYLYEWLLTIFSRSLPLDVTHRIWDNFLCLGHVFLFRTALGLLRMQQSTFLQCSFEECLALLNRPPRDFEADTLFADIAKVSVSEERVAKLLKEAA